MKLTASPNGLSAYLGIECGATHSVALLVDTEDQVRQRIEAGPANIQLVTDSQLVRHFRGYKAQMEKPSALGIGMAGARTESDWGRIRRAAARVWPGIPCYATHDLETALMAAESSIITPPQRSSPKANRASIRPPADSLRDAPRVLVLSGTGSCCYGQSSDGQRVKVGGWGHLLGDHGSGYDIGLSAVKSVIQEFDYSGVWPDLGSQVLRALQLNEPEDLVAWIHAADKPAVAALAPQVFAAWRRRDRMAGRVIENAAGRLVQDAIHCAHRLAQSKTRIRFVLAGSILLRQPRFASRISRELASLWPESQITPLKRESAWGAVELAKRLVPAMKGQKGPERSFAPMGESRDPQLTQTLVQSPTEQRNPRSMNLDRLPIRQAIQLMLEEDARVPDAIKGEQQFIERAIRLIVRAFRAKGRLVYVGAGTSGRLGVLDASECPPTFGVDPNWVQGIVAGGQRALWQSLEGAEDDPHAGAAAVRFRKVAARDVVVGIAASGRTPFVWGALREAKQRGAKTVLVCFNPHLVIARADRPTVVIAPNVGPEILTGSTRLKAGTATKLILNILTTLAMVQLGKVRSNLMVDVTASNEKLRDRATRIVMELTKWDYETARKLLREKKWNIGETASGTPIP